METAASPRHKENLPKWMHWNVGHTLFLVWGTLFCLKNLESFSSQTLSCPLHYSHWNCMAEEYISLLSVMAAHLDVTSCSSQLIWTLCSAYRSEKRKENQVLRYVPSDKTLEVKETSVFSGSALVSEHNTRGGKMDQRWLKNSKMSLLGYRDVMLV